MIKSILILVLISAFELAYCEISRISQSIESDTLKVYEQPQVDIFGKREEQLKTIPGAAELISTKEIESAQPVSGSEMLKQVSGVHINEEDGLGLRMNLGMRGLDPDRSRTLHVMEDGVPLALAPYGEPEMYYTPAIERISNIELLKGSGSIVFGPQTIGGVLNYITPDPPLEGSTHLTLRGGNGGYFSANGSYGSSFESAGFTMNLLHKRADNIGVLRFEITDFTSKFNLKFSERSRLGVKFSVYNEHSDATYVGITQKMYDAGQYFTQIAPNDNLDIRRYSVSLTHHLTLGENTYLKTTGFGYTTTRNWMRQDFSRTKSGSLTGVVWGDTSVAGGALYMRNSTGNRDRQFEVFGIEPRLFTQYSFVGFSNTLETGFRVLREIAYEQSVNGKKAGTLSGDLTLDEVRTGTGLSGYVQNKLFLTTELSITPGIRFEHFSFERAINRISSRDTSLIGTDDLAEFIPGIGINYNLAKFTTVFAGIHKGFAPPRIKDAIDNSGATLQLEAERSVNIEIGMRSRVFSWLSLESTVYQLSFSNQVIPVSASSGGSGFGLANGGKTIHRGVEFGFLAMFENVVFEGLNVKLHGNVTQSESQFDSDRFVAGQNINGNNIPYAPKSLLNGNLTLVYHGLELQVGVNSVGEHYADELNTVMASNDGQIGLIPAYTVIDATVRYGLPTAGLSLMLSAKNLTDERYISSRRPQGIKVGIPSMFTVGLDVQL